ncbi:bifunctional histidinol-phosphatase/imidazoleglycerol-phosphate dehydratase HisB [Marivirga sp. S37H4]|uniref:Histidine biosynthesis bifunctional protein HisB n=1 Tax=Marivirga aurantiaca TaxID=2802615 RepID=A0A934WX98_9BACT|nr:bifunctional histidinol-phosphatase/imidazoleglycerol-phosphate dehydratase HisB [Marivirga aurantiaca]MBK6264809.1 bifunctional histidinol-phosphatase/imidazoleglycerol-phosphate dehydratase HisB [Marivirga aurantiaca]
MKKKVLFIDRDGTLIKEPPSDFQVDSLEKLEFLPFALSSLQKIVQNTDYELVMVTNQDGLGTDSFPEDTFWPAHNKMMQQLENEGIVFDEVLIDKSFEEEKKPTRKPQTGLLQKYLSDDYDLANSYVIGDRRTDVALASNLGAQSIFIGDQYEEATFCTKDWKEIAHFLVLPNRKAVINRKTNETDIFIELNLDGSGKVEMNTGLKFFDHMLDQLGKHGGLNLKIEVNGDLEVDEHHTIEDTALALGEAFKQALGNKKGIYRYGFLLPMDDALAQVGIDFGGRPWINWKADFKREKVGDMPTEMFFHFFKSFTDAAQCNLDIQVSGDNEHHKIEAIFKAWARAIKMAVSRDESRLQDLPSTKGTL